MFVSGRGLRGKSDSVPAHVGLRAGAAAGRHASEYLEEHIFLATTRKRIIQSDFNSRLCIGGQPGATPDGELSVLPSLAPSLENHIRGQPDNRTAKNKYPR